MRTAHIIGPDAGSKTEAGIIGQAQGLLFRVERHHAEHGAEHFLPRDLHIGANVQHHRGRHEQAPGRARVVQTAAGEAGAVRERLAQHALHLRVLAGCRHWSHLGLRIGRVAHPDGAGSGRDAADEIVHRLALHQQP